MFSNGHGEVSFVMAGVSLKSVRPAPRMNRIDVRARRCRASMRTLEVMAGNAFKIAPAFKVF